MRETMFAASKVIAQGRAGDRIAEIRERCRTAAQHFVQIADKIHNRPGDRVDVFNAVVDAFRCYVTETWMIDLGLTSLTNWASDIPKRRRHDPSAMEILERRLYDLADIRRHIAETPLRRQLLGRIEAVESKLIAEFGFGTFRRSA
jgi:hypothetical protein